MEEQLFKLEEDQETKELRQMMGFSEFLRSPQRRHYKQMEERWGKWTFSKLINHKIEQFKCAICGITNNEKYEIFLHLEEEHGLEEIFGLLCEDNHKISYHGQDHNYDDSHDSSQSTPASAATFSAGDVMEAAQELMEMEASALERRH